MKDKTLGILASWNLFKYKGAYYSLHTHYSYLEYITFLYEKIYLVTSIDEVDEIDASIEKYNVSNISNIEIVELPKVTSSISALKLYPQFKKAVKRVIPKVDVFYSRTPDPYSWMPALLGHKRTIMHFVGDIIEAANFNVHWSKLKKKIMIAGYMPEWYLTLKASQKSVVYTNGIHIAERLKKYHITAKPMVSSTISKSSLDKSLHQLPIEKGKVVLTFMSFISYHKGINCMMEVMLKLKETGIDFRFNVIGKGDMAGELKTFVEANGLSDKVILHGYMNDRDAINEILESSDLFFFASMSEGSPRVTIEAMAMGLPLVSTPVASLPYCFEDKESIRFFNFGDSDKAFEIIKEYLDNPNPFIKQRDKAFALVKEKYTKENFLSTVFSYEE